MNKHKFYHAGCPVCLSAEQEIVSLIGTDKVEVIHLGENRERIAEATEQGVRSVPALVTETGCVLHINFGAAIDAI